MIYAEVLTEWIGDGLTPATGYRPRISDDYPQDAYQYRLSDVTDQNGANIPPDPNLVVVGITCDAALVALLEADANYEVLWSEEL